MKKVLIPVMALFVLFMVTPVMAPAIKFPVAGSCLVSATVPGKVWIDEDWILHVRGAEAEGSAFGFIEGDFAMTLNADIDLITKDGSANGKWVLTDTHGTFEGSYRCVIWGVIYYRGTAVGQGTGAYEGMAWSLKNVHSRDTIGIWAVIRVQMGFTLTMRLRYYPQRVNHYHSYAI